MFKQISTAKLKEISNQEWANVREGLSPKFIRYFDEGRNVRSGRRGSLEWSFKTMIMHTHGQDFSPTYEMTL